MASISIDLDFRHIDSRTVLVSRLSPAFLVSRNDTVYFEVNLNRTHILYSDWLLLVVCTFQHFKKRDVRVSGRFIDFDQDCDKVRYASRVNFFDLIGFEFKERFARRNASGRFTEIRYFDQSNVRGLFNEIMKILMVNGVNEDMLTVLNFCLWELLDNTLNHSGEGFAYGSGSGYACAQYFPSRQEVRIIIADTGIGIHRALTTHPKSEYKHYSQREAVLNCINRGVTNSEGLGFGLWATAEMMRKNHGEMVIHSGTHSLLCKSDTHIHETKRWQGTYTFLRINTNIPVDHRGIFGENSDQQDMYQEFR